ncbi:hypothetical protein PAPYR_8890 [Paratrimastix pyriformis]|uniref:Uncharacterized protein n=1 Tax=Paratrimastix pyriformis TaxID=342808 RepID=A0ABQ8U9Q9_9EUKA|nr:hypothetical protein PAPYR_8890 [Paratrimastix pyriformis]
MKEEEPFFPRLSRLSSHKPPQYDPLAQLEGLPGNSPPKLAAAPVETPRKTPISGSARTPRGPRSSPPGEGLRSSPSELPESTPLADEFSMLLRSMLHPNPSEAPPAISAPSTITRTLLSARSGALTERATSNSPRRFPLASSLPTDRSMPPQQPQETPLIPANSPYKDVWSRLYSTQIPSPRRHIMQSPPRGDLPTSRSSTDASAAAQAAPQLQPKTTSATLQRMMLLVRDRFHGKPLNPEDAALFPADQQQQPSLQQQPVAATRPVGLPVVPSLGLGPGAITPRYLDTTPVLASPRHPGGIPTPCAPAVAPPPAAAAIPAWSPHQPIELPSPTLPHLAAIKPATTTARQPSPTRPEGPLDLGVTYPGPLLVVRPAGAAAAIPGDAEAWGLTERERAVALREMWVAERERRVVEREISHLGLAYANATLQPTPETLFPPLSTFLDTPPPAVAPTLVSLAPSGLHPTHRRVLELYWSQVQSRLAAHFSGVLSPTLAKKSQRTSSPPSSPVPRPGGESASAAEPLPPSTPPPQSFAPSRAATLATTTTPFGSAAPTPLTPDRAATLPGVPSTGVTSTGVTSTGVTSTGVPSTSTMTGVPSTPPAAPSPSTLTSTTLSSLTTTSPTSHLRQGPLTPSPDRSSTSSVSSSDQAVELGPSGPLDLSPAAGLEPPALVSPAPSTGFGGRTAHRLQDTGVDMAVPPQDPEEQQELPARRLPVADYDMGAATAVAPTPSGGDVAPTPVVDLAPAPAAPAEGQTPGTPTAASPVRFDDPFQDDEMY